MAVVKPFRAVRPTPELVDKVAALPYDVMDTSIWPIRPAALIRGARL